MEYDAGFTQYSIIKSEEYSVDEELIPTTDIGCSLDQSAAGNCIYMAQDGKVEIMGDLIEEQVEQADNDGDYNKHQYFHCQEVIEEAITDNWLHGEERFEIPVEHENQDQDVDVPLPNVPDEYTTTHPYPCEFCSRRFRMKSDLISHMVAHKNDHPHNNLCVARFIRRMELVNHLKIHNKEFENQSTSRLVMEKNQQVEQCLTVIDISRPSVCHKCGVYFARKKALSNSKMHGGDSMFECDSCSEIFLDLTLLQDRQKLQHVDQTSNSENEPQNERDYSGTTSKTDITFGDIYCSVCGMSFHLPDLLRRHARTHITHDDVNPTTQHRYNVGGEFFIKPLDLLAQSEAHARSPFKCMLCRQTFLEESTIKEHIANVHDSEINENTCKLCGKQCRDNKSLMKHSWEHSTGDSTKKNRSCSVCDETFHSEAQLKCHMPSHPIKSFTCDVCGDDFPNGRSLMNHRHLHSNVSKRQFPCEECGKIFRTRSSQQIHARLHTGDRPYGCRFCWKAFCDGGSLNKHERIHTGEKPYVCPVCLRAFNQRVVLRDHIRCHHSVANTENGNTMTPFYCTVCTNLFVSSSELIQHLIEHADINTAMKRQLSTGLRKYKRRRKLKPHDYADDEDMNNQSKNYGDDYEKDMVDVMKNEEIEREQVEAKLPRIWKNKISFTHSQQTSRPKMIHTQRIRATVEGGKQKTITSIIRTSGEDPVPTRISNRSDRFLDLANDLDKHFPSPIKSTESNNKYIHPPTIQNQVTANRIRGKQQESIRKREKSSTEMPQAEWVNIQIKAEVEAEADSGGDKVFTCEMCSTRFRDRTQLLKHVNVHI